RRQSEQNATDPFQKAHSGQYCLTYQAFWVASMRRRDFIGSLVGSAVAWPFAARAQKAPARIGFLASGGAGSANSAAQIDAIKKGLSDSGLVEGRDYVLESRFAAGNYGLFPGMAHELAQGGARILLVNTILSVRAAQNVTPPVPVVMLAINDP